QILTFTGAARVACRESGQCGTVRDQQRVEPAFEISPGRPRPILAFTHRRNAQAASMSSRVNTRDAPPSASAVAMTVTRARTTAWAIEGSRSPMSTCWPTIGNANHAWPAREGKKTTNIPASIGTKVRYLRAELASFVVRQKTATSRFTAAP